MNGGGEHGMVRRNRRLIARLTPSHNDTLMNMGYYIRSMAEVRRTVVVKLAVDDDDATLLHETVEEYLWACNYVVRDAWQDGYKTTSKTKLHNRTYSNVREQTHLQANLESTGSSSGSCRSRRCRGTAGWPLRRVFPQM